MVQALLTLAYEGGHPDHDSCSFLSAQLAGASIPCWEAPLITGGGSSAFQEFMQASYDVDTPTALNRTQARDVHGLSLAGRFPHPFDVTKELVRPQPAYDFTKPPHEGRPTTKSGSGA